MGNSFVPIYDTSWGMLKARGKIEEDSKSGDFRIVGISTIDLFNEDPELLGKYMMGAPATYWLMLVFHKDNEVPVFSINLERSLHGQFLIAYIGNTRLNFGPREETPEELITSYEDFKEVAISYVNDFISGKLIEPADDEEADEDQ